jgi:hypothetical protein
MPSNVPAPPILAVPEFNGIGISPISDGIPSLYKPISMKSIKINGHKTSRSTKKIAVISPAGLFI